MPPSCVFDNYLAKCYALITEMLFFARMPDFAELCTLELTKTGEMKKNRIHSEKSKVWMQQSRHWRGSEAGVRLMPDDVHLLQLLWDNMCTVAILYEEPTLLRGG